VADPLQHCALNVALYAGAGKRWALTERGRRSVHRTSDTLVIGPSAARWDGNGLTVDIDERTAPVPSRIRGRVRLFPDALVAHSFALDAAGRHQWRPIAPCARVEVSLEYPRVHWVGAGYFDCNAGNQPLEDAFTGWHWSRSTMGGETCVLYDVDRRDGDRTALALRFDAAGDVQAISPPPRARLPPTRWRIARETRSDAGVDATILATLEDAPFYARSTVAAQLFGGRVTAVHESLSLDRFRRAWVKLLLPFRMPRPPG
jgi:carotenoid 1,2-hydratase